MRMCFSWMSSLLQGTSLRLSWAPARGTFLSKKRFGFSRKPIKKSNLGLEPKWFPRALLGSLRGSSGFHEGPKRDINGIFLSGSTSSEFPPLLAKEYTVIAKQMFHELSTEDKFTPLVAPFLGTQTLGRAVLPPLSSSGGVVQAYCNDGSGFHGTGDWCLPPARAADCFRDLRIPTCGFPCPSLTFFTGQLWQ